MKTINILCIALLLAGGSAFAQETWTIDPVNSSINFEVGHLLVSTASGTFRKFSGTLTTQGPNIEGGRVAAQVEVTSVDTGNSGRDNHLRSADFFEVDKFPTMTFESTTLKKTDGNNYLVEGNLTLHGVTKPVSLKAKQGGRKTIGGGKEVMGFKATGMVNRKDFGITSNSASVGDEVEFVINLELGKAQPK